MGRTFKKGEILKSRDLNTPIFRICTNDKFVDDKDEFELIDFKHSELKEFKFKTTDEISFILQLLGKKSSLTRDDVQRLLDDNFTFDFNHYTFNTTLSDFSICVIQVITDEKTIIDENGCLKIIISNQSRDTQLSSFYSDVDGCYQEIELYLIRNSPTLSFDYFKENLKKYKKEIVKSIPEIEPMIESDVEVEVDVEVDADAQNGLSENETTVDFEVLDDKKTPLNSIVGSEIW